MTRLAGFRPIMSAGLAGLAFLLFFPLFIYRRLGPLDFWWGLSASVLALSGLALLFDRDSRRAVCSDVRAQPARKISLGLISAAVLYLLFALGSSLLRSFFPWAGLEIGQVYALQAGASSSRIFLCLILVVGPGEEVFWRGFLQNRAQTGLGKLAGWLATSALYTAVHLGSGNLSLVLAAAVGGLFWGFLYLRFRSVLLNAVSHAFWDVAVFLIRPVG